MCRQLCGERPIRRNRQVICEYVRISAVFTRQRRRCRHTHPEPASDLDTFDLCESKTGGNNVATVRSAMLPGLRPASLRSSSKAASSRAAPATVCPAATRLSARTADRFGYGRAELATDMAVGKSSKQAQIERSHLPRLVAAIGRDPIARLAKLEHVPIGRRVLARDEIAVRRLAHRLDQRDLGGLTDVVFG